MNGNDRGYPLAQSEFEIASGIASAFSFSTPILRRTETVSLPEDGLYAPAFVPQFFSQPANVHIQRACARLRRVTPDLHQKNRAGDNLSSVLDQ
jgi:hypothetical protein